MRQQSTFLGFLWTLLNPALLFLVLYTLFIKWIGKLQPDYAVFLIAGIIEWNYFSSATTYALSTLLRRRSLVANYPVAPELPVLACVLTSAFSHYLELASLFAVLTLFAGGPHLNWLLLVPLELSLLALICGVSFFVSVLYVFFLDIERIYAILMSAAFFLTPVFYPLSTIGAGRRWLPELNPLTHAIEALRAMAIPGYSFTPGGLAFLAAAGLAAAAAGTIFIRKTSARVAERL